MQQVTSTDLSLYEHEDEPVTFHFYESDLDCLEEYDMNFYDDEWLDMDAIDDKEALRQLTFPYSKQEPELDSDQLVRLDAIADSLEIKRLTKMNVLTDANSVPSDAKRLSTRFVRTWREKQDSSGNAIWLRRSRFVAREFAWLQPERDSLFSPASSAIVSRLLPTLFLDIREHVDAVMVAVDFKDAFLTVQQQTPTIVTCQLADGQTLNYGLGRVLPGQRDGSLLWHRDVTNVLKSKLGMSEHAPYPCILKTDDNCCFLLIHVDDVLVIGKRDFVENKLLKCLQKKYEISTQVVREAGDELSFLKRKMTLQHDGRMLIQTHHRHVLQMCSLLGLNSKLQGKKTPGHADMDMDDSTSEVSPKLATTFRTCVGILLYLAADLPHCQHVVRHLSTYSTQPTVKSMNVLKHLVSYLAGHDDLCVSLKGKGRSCGVYHSYNNIDPGECVLEIFTDSDWASDRRTRRSVSCVTVFAGGCSLYSASRTQKLVSLSSAEAEVYACSSGTSDALLLARLLIWMFGKRVVIHAYTDSSAAKGILQRQGVGRLRHLSCRVLWMQQLVASGELKLGSVPGNENPADIGAKRLPVSRMRSLMGVLGIFNVSNGLVEGSDDPGGIFKKKKQNVMAILSALSLLQIQGCETAEPSWGVMMFTAVIGFVILCGLTWVSLFQFGHHPQFQSQQPGVPEPDSEQEPTPPQPPLRIDLPSYVVYTATLTPACTAVC